ncbi:RidA family protein [Streptomyces acidiscabies]|uniref:RidA family protein n=1 Tax=Streptomyces acidiscabies TaxID=42234 RepID=UPI0038F78FBA
MSNDVRTITNPPALHDPTPFGYGHVVSAPGELACTRLESALSAVGLGLQHVVRLGTFVVDHDADKLQALGKVLHARFGDRLPAQTLNGVASLALPGMLFEVDAIAVRPV